MKVQLGQHEIESAIKDYISKLGIALKDLDVVITFTAGRGVQGLTADLDITENTDIPGFTGEAIAPEPINAEPPLKVVKDTPPKAAKRQAAEDAPTVTEGTPVLATSSAEDPKVDEPASVPKATTSLFGG